jgi:hypothetical protein
VARHIFQACPVWIYTQSNITNITHYYYACKRTKYSHSIQLNYDTEMRILFSTWFSYKYAAEYESLK